MNRSKLTKVSVLGKHKNMTNLVNIDSNWYFDDEVDSHSVEGDLKHSPHDFVVREIYKFQPQLPGSQTFSSSSSHNKKRSFSLFNKENTDGVECSEQDIIDFITPPVWDQLELLATWTQQPLLSDDMSTSIIIDNISNKHKYADIRRLIMKRFPTLKTESKQLESSSSNASSLSSIVITPDNCIFLPLSAQGMSPSDIDAIYKFYRLGAGDEAAEQGLRVGLNLSREARGVCFQILRAALPSLDSKTVDATTTPYHRQQKKDYRKLSKEISEQLASEKVMLIHWTKKALHNASLRRKSAQRVADESTMLLNVVENEGDQKQEQEEDKVSDVPVSTDIPASGDALAGTIFLGFTLMKHNMEQMRAVQLVAEALGLSLSDVTVAGVKDKIAVTFQQACLRLHYNASNSQDYQKISVSGVDSDAGSIYLVPDVDMTDNSISADTSTTSSALITAAMKDWDHASYAFPNTRIVDCESFCQQVPSAARQVLISALHTLSQYSTAPTRSTDPTTGDMIKPDYVTEWYPFVAVNYFYLRTSALNTGELWGNEFDITIRNPTRRSHDTSINSSTHSLREEVQRSLGFVQKCGFPNFYGSQRMGYSNGMENSMATSDLLAWVGVRNQPSMLPSGPLIGRLLLTGQLDIAIHMIVLDSLAATFSSNGSSLPDNEEGVECVVKDSEEIEEITQDDHMATSVDNTIESQRQEELQAEHGHSTPQVQEDYLSLVTGQNTFDERQVLRSILKALPRSATRAKIVLRAMVRYGYTFPKHSAESHSTDDAPSTSQNMSKTGASVQSQILQQIPYSMRSLWVSAYQSWIWNHAAWHRLSSGESGSNEVMVGDLLMTDIEDDRARAVTVVSETKLAEWSPEERRTRLAQVALPLFGSKVIYPTNESGEFYQALLMKEGLLMANVTDASVSLNPSVGGTMPRGAYRKILVSFYLSHLYIITLFTYLFIHLFARFVCVTASCTRGIGRG